MNYRLYSKIFKSYVDGPYWQTEVGKFSRWSITEDGKIQQVICGKDGKYGIWMFSAKEFDIEPWTGFFDSEGQKIYRGDILRMSSFFVFKSEVVWKDGAFWLKALDEKGVDCQFDGRFSKDWTIVGNIHSV